MCPNSERSLLVSVALCGLLAVAAMPAVAETETGAGPEAKEVFYDTATVEARELSTATAPVTVIERAEIERLGALTAADALHFVPGVTVTEAGTRGGLSVAQIRGGDPNFTLVLIDGVPVNDGTYQVGGVFDLEGLPASSIERIEVVRGPFASYYGSTGLGGVVHIMTRSAGAVLEDLESEAELTVGDGDHFGGRVLLQSRTFTLGASWEEEAERVAEESFEQLHLHGKGRWSWGDAERPSVLSLAGRATSWDADDYPDASGGPLYGDGALRMSEHEEFGLSLQLALPMGTGPASSHHRASVSIYRHQLDRDSPAVFPLVPPSIEETTFTRLHAGWTWSRDIAPGMRLSLGADVEHEDGDNQSVLVLPPFFGGAIVGDYSLERTTPGAVVDLLTQRGDWTVELAARVDWPDIDGPDIEGPQIDGADGDGADDPGSQFSPRLGVAYQLCDTWRLRASAGRAFKLPSFFALASPPALGGNPNLEPETMTGGDLGLEWQAANAATGGGIGVFRHEYEDLVDFDFQLFTHLNRSRVQAEGVEAWFTWSAAPGSQVEGWSLAADVTYQDVEDEATGLTLRQRPEWSGGLRLDWRPPALQDAWAFHLDVRRQSERRDEQIPVPQFMQVPGYTVVGLGALWNPEWRLPVWEGLRLQVRVDNLLDEDYETYIGFPAPGRSLRAGLRVTL